MALTKVEIIPSQGKLVAAPGKRPNHASLKGGQQIQWFNRLAVPVSLILFTEATDVFEPPVQLVSTIPANDHSPVLQVQGGLRQNLRGFYSYKVYVQATNQYVEGGSDPEIEIK